MTLRRAQRVTLALTLAVFAATWWRPLWPLEQALHGSLAVVGLSWLGAHARRWPTRDSDFALVCAFIAIHSIGARWLYSNVPYDAWFQALFDWSPTSAFGWRRNHFDRFIHILYGLTFMPLLCHHLRQRWPLNARQAFALAVLLIMASGLVYEWAEWGVALALSPEQAEAYNGQQGDIWDAHKDMLLAALGALALWPWLGRERQEARDG
ncbi:DUF2238 domain-containing protein [Vulcaniibacterium thermophilum]|uniref:DUF2238 domain-containing protein n=1 Tax=Vulcaniibacterium thermophilum TaxID=1169913 RepID=A0A918Z084_9GAMM|nr:DUF2238 domain-containing protein [Vulcaniibacterium thermophilum]GHE32135.1 hypothetical protein GCM10007167_12720 [Vulcaniibacterium thermophilum]